MASCSLTVEEIAEHTHTIYRDNNYCPVHTGNINSKWEQALVGLGVNVSRPGTKYELGIGYAGKSTPHTNIQPSVATYGWKRVA